jgi:hypothetical protein
MTRISSLFVASALAILPISAFAQQTAAPAQTTAPASTATPHGRQDAQPRQGQNPRQDRRTGEVLTAKAFRAVGASSPVPNRRL